MKIVQFLITVVIIVASIISYRKGEPADWYLFFSGWGYLAFLELKEIFRND